LILKKNRLPLKSFFLLRSFIGALVKILGTISLVGIVFIIYYYYSSGLATSFGLKKTILDFNRVVLNKYIGLDLTKFSEYLDVYSLKLNLLNKDSNLPIIRLDLSQKDILFLERQRNKKKTYSAFSEGFKSTNIKISLNNLEKIKAKIRIKGDRAMHWKDPKASSYKINLRKENRIFGIKKFSIQKPITRNYTYELLFHKFLQTAGHVHLKYFLVDLFINNEKRGVYVVEESFSKELIERHKKRNGPIFSLDEQSSNFYPSVNYEAYNPRIWDGENKNLTKRAYAILNKIKSNEIELIDHFDEDKWASYFAIIDVMGTYHGSLSKSVRLYYNPVTAKFEPIGYDAHYGAGDFSDFILFDFLQEGRPNCIYICDEKEWYLKFFRSKTNELNYTFIKKYISYLLQYSNKKFVKQFLKDNKKNIDSFNQAIYKENSKTDQIFYKGIAPFLFDKKFISKRSDLIKRRIDSVRLEQYKLSLDNKKLLIQDNSSQFPVEVQAYECSNNKRVNFFFAGSMKVQWPHGCKKISIIKNKEEEKTFNLKEDASLTQDYNIKKITDFQLLSEHSSVIKKSDNEFEIETDINIATNTLIKKNQTFKIKKNVNININNNSTLFINGDIYFRGSKNKNIGINSDKTGSIVFNKNRVEMSYVNIQNLGYPKLNGYILYSGLNFIESSVNLKNIYIKNNNSEDAINLINSNTYVENMTLENTYSDALDGDFGSLEFKNIKCKNVGNDCLDVSGAKIKGDYLIVAGARDKGISVGENSKVIIKNINVSSAKVGIAVKDGSKAWFSNINLKNNTYDLAVYNKKNEYEPPSMNIEKIKYESKQILQSFNSIVVIDQKKLKGIFDNKFIKSILY